MAIHQKPCLDSFPEQHQSLHFPGSFGSPPGPQNIVTRIFPSVGTPLPHRPSASVKSFLPSASRGTGATRCQASRPPSALRSWWRSLTLARMPRRAQSCLPRPRARSRHSVSASRGAEPPLPACPGPQPSPLRGARSCPCHICEVHRLRFEGAKLPFVGRVSALRGVELPFFGSRSVSVSRGGRRESAVSASRGAELPLGPGAWGHGSPLRERGAALVEYRTGVSALKVWSYL